MRRKVIQIAGSTQLVSLPRQWAKKHNLQRGQEVEVQENGNTVIVKADATPVVETAHIDITPLRKMARKVVDALYKRGVDELTVSFSNVSDIRTVQDAISNEAVGFEILEQGENYCVIKYVSGGIEKFDSLLRRTFLLLLNMSNQTCEHLKKSNFASLQNTAFLEEANNRFTTICRRYLNKSAEEHGRKTGPVYYIVEELEKLADHYKYLCQHFAKIEKKDLKLDKRAIDLFARADGMLRLYYELFYKFDPNKFIKLTEQREFIVSESHRLLPKNLNYANSWLIYHSLMISNRIFEMTGALLSLKL